MGKTVRAVYENGVLRPLEPLSLPEHREVEVSVSEVAAEPEDERLDEVYHRGLQGVQVPEVSLEEVRRILSKIPGSLSDEFIAEREERL
ncbi:MAG: antitoxin family protein [Acidobacteriota bacterium]